MRFLRKVSVVAFSVLIAGGIAVSPASPADAAPRKFANCTEMHKVYPNGVARSRYAATHAKPRSTQIRPPKISKALYKANKNRDRDKDGVACERS